MRVAYLVQTHRTPAQVIRLLGTLRRGSPGAVLVVAHDPAAEPLDPHALEEVGAGLFRPDPRPCRGYWSMLTPYVQAVELLDRLGTSYDWLVYLSGQDYPVQPLAVSEARWAQGGYDGYLTWMDAAAESPEGRRRQGRLRYLYQYGDLPRAARLLPLLRKLNGLQPWWHVHLTYGPRLGHRASRTPFSAGFRPYWGSQWTTLHRACAERVAEVARTEPALVEYFARTICPDESFVQTVLGNDRRFRLCNDNLRFIDMQGSRDGRPRILRLADGPTLVTGGFAFARKFDVEVDAAILDWLDERLTPPGALGAPGDPRAGHPPRTFRTTSISSAT